MFLPFSLKIEYEIYSTSKMYIGQNFPNISNYEKSDVAFELSFET